MVAYGLGFCSKGSRMFKPTDVPPASAAPLLAASMIPPPPPVITPNPFFTKRAAMACAFLYCRSSGRVLADPKMLTAGPRSWRPSTPSTNSPMILNSRQDSPSLRSSIKNCFSIKFLCFHSTFDVHSSIHRQNILAKQAKNNKLQSPNII